MLNAALPQNSVPFPGAAVRRSSPFTGEVRAVQARLGERGCGPLAADGAFGPWTEAAARLFQGRSFDRSGAPLLADGQVGPVAWAALFGAASLPPLGEGSAFAAAALRVAAGQVGVVEDPPGSNGGEAVGRFLAPVGLGPGNAWCAAFVYWCADRASAETGRPNHLPKTGGVLETWRRARKAGLPCVSAPEARARPALVMSGMVFVMDHGAGRGHMGHVEGFSDGRLRTVEGNSSDGGSREGTGVFALARRTLGSVNGGSTGLP
jgi:hypothetical protein